MDILAERLSSGDPAAFVELYDAHADRLHHYLAVRLGSRDEADDVLQEVFVRLVRARRQLGRVGPAQNAATYLRRAKADIDAVNKEMFPIYEREYTEGYQRTELDRKAIRGALEAYPQLFRLRQTHL